jgi:putative endonuclease
MSGHRRQQGMYFERRARQFLETQGLGFHAANVHLQQGEIDLIMFDQEILVFVEVRSRSSTHFGYAEESITLRKQQSIIRTAQAYLAQHPSVWQQAIRFDLITFNGKTSMPAWYQGIFSGLDSRCYEF